MLVAAALPPIWMSRYLLQCSPEKADDSLLGQWCKFGNAHPVHACNLLFFLFLEYALAR